MARAGNAESVERFVIDVNQDESEMVRAAMAFALYKKGHVTYLGRLIDFADARSSWHRSSRDTSSSSGRRSFRWSSSGCRSPTPTPGATS